MSRNRGQSTFRRAVRVNSKQQNDKPKRGYDGKRVGTTEFAEGGGRRSLDADGAIFIPPRKPKLKGYMKDHKGKKIRH